MAANNAMDGDQPSNFRVKDPTFSRVPQKASARRLYEEGRVSILIDLPIEMVNRIDNDRGRARRGLAIEAHLNKVFPEMP